MTGYTHSVVRAKECDGGTHYRIADQDDNRIATCWTKENADRIVRALNAELDNTDEVAIRANARLIAAAPELLEACKGLLNGGAEWLGGTEYRITCANLEPLRAAIAKATA